MMAVTVSNPTRRERQRAATVNEIKDAARQQLVTGGPQAISLRAVARDVGLTPAALYRYFPSLQALLEDLCADVYGELTGALETARDAGPADDPVALLLHTARAFRHWCIARPSEFALLFGHPPPELDSFDQDCPAHQAGMASAGVFVRLFTDIWDSQPHLRQEQPGSAVSAARPPFTWLAEALPSGAFPLFLSGWIRLYGLIAMEIFGHLRWAVTDTGPVFEAELADYARRLTGRPG